MAVLVFDIETVPDVEFGRRLFNLDGLTDTEVGDVMYAKRLQQAGNDFLPCEQQRVVAISVALRSRDGLRVWSLGEPHTSEAEIIQRFYEGLQKYTPDLISWNGGGFDLPVLHYRALRHSVQAPRYWETGDEDQAFRFNNYLNRFHWRHLDLMDVLSGYQSRSRASLQSIALLLGFPGKMGMSGDQVWQSYLRGEIEHIRNYCETDVLNTYLVYLRFELMRGRISPTEHAEEEKLVRATLESSAKPYARAFLQAWGEPS